MIFLIFDYFDALGNAIEFIIALGSIFGILLLIVGILGWLFLGQFQRHKMIKVIVSAVILLILCGVSTGIQYFRIY